MRKLRLALAVLVAALALAQAVPVARTNPPVESLVPAPPAVLAALKRSCWDCHSNETVWGWHTRVAPISWLVASDVNEGREELNFSRWNAVGAKRLGELARKIPEEVGDGDMPPFLYRLAHPDSKPTDAERAELVAWARTLGAAPASAAPSAVEPAAASEGGHGAREREEREEHERR